MFSNQHEVFHYKKAIVTREAYFIQSDLERRWRRRKRCLAQCDQIWQNFATLAKVYKFLVNFCMFFLIWQNASQFWHICDFIRLIFIVANGQILIDNLTIWSHCLAFDRKLWGRSFVCSSRNVFRRSKKLLFSPDKHVSGVDVKNFFWAISGKFWFPLSWKSNNMPF